MEMTLHRALPYALSLMLLGLPAVSGAQAFGLNEIGSRADSPPPRSPATMRRAFTGTPEHCHKLLDFRSMAAPR
jgi:hypothetical protein